MLSALSARDFEDALRDRILRGVPSREPAAVGPRPCRRARRQLQHGRPALQELAKKRWVGVTNHRGTVVGRDLPAGETGQRDLEAAVRQLAVRWRLAGGDFGSFGELVGHLAYEVFRPAPRILLLECNPVDLQRGLEQV